MCIEHFTERMQEKSNKKAPTLREKVAKIFLRGRLIQVLVCLQNV